MNSPLPTQPDGLVSTLEGLGHQASDLALGSARNLRDQALHARDSTAVFVQQQPLAALLMAAAGGAAVMLLAGLLMRSSSGRH